MHPRSIVVPALAAVSLFFPAAAEAQVRASERGGVFQIVDGTTITLEYSRPVARGRLLFGPGAVVPYGHRWTPGANWATTLETDRDIQVNGQPVPKGKYSVWMVPGPEEWTVMLSRMAHAFHVQPPADSSAQARFVVKPATGAHMETLAWYFPVIAPHAATLRLHWGTTIVPLHLTVQPSRPVVLDPAERAPYVGKYQLASQLEGLSEPRILEVFEIDGRVRARVTPALFDHDAELDLVPAGRGRFHPGWYLAGKFFDVETDMAFIFTVERGRARSVDFRGLAENLLFAHGERIP